MMQLDEDLIIGGAVVVGLLLVVGVVFVVSQGGLTGAGKSVGGAVPNVIGGALDGFVVATGEQVGIPATSDTACARALAEGRTWDASFACPAGTFLKSFFH